MKDKLQVQAKPSTIASHAITASLSALFVVWLTSSHTAAPAPSGQLSATAVLDALKPCQPQLQPPPEKCSFPASTPPDGCANPLEDLMWVAKPAPCRVKGHLIEKLDPELHFRRGYALRYSDYVEDRTALLPWLLGAKEDLGSAARRVYIDFGGNSFSSSVQWFLDYYPVDFTEMHVFEVRKDLFKLPEHTTEASSLRAEKNNVAHYTSSRPTVSSCGLSRLKVYNTLVSSQDGDDRINATRFIKEFLGLKPQDTVILKMDIEGAEWDLLPQWLEDAEMAQLVDEIFVEMHYGHEEMHGFAWRFPWTLEQAASLLEQMRARGFYIHAWP